MATRADAPASGRAPPGRRSSTIPPIRGIVFQVALVVFLASRFFWWIVDNTITNLQRANIASGFGFLEQPRRLRDPHSR